MGNRYAEMRTRRQAALQQQQRQLELQQLQRQQQQQQPQPGPAGPFGDLGLKAPDYWLKMQEQQKNMPMPETDEYGRPTRTDPKTGKKQYYQHMARGGAWMDAGAMDKWGQMDTSMFPQGQTRTPETWNPNWARQFGQPGYFSVPGQQPQNPWASYPQQRRQPSPGMTGMGGYGNPWGKYGGF